MSKNLSWFFANIAEANDPTFKEFVQDWKSLETSAAELSRKGRQLAQKAANDATGDAVDVLADAESNFPESIATYLKFMETQFRTFLFLAMARRSAAVFGENDGFASLLTLAMQDFQFYDGLLTKYKPMLEFGIHRLADWAHPDVREGKLDLSRDLNEYANAIKSFNAALQQVMDKSLPRTMERLKELMGDG